MAIQRIGRTPVRPQLRLVARIAARGQLHTRSVHAAGQRQLARAAALRVVEVVAGDVGLPGRVGEAVEADVVAVEAVVVEVVGIGLGRLGRHVARQEAVEDVARDLADDRIAQAVGPAGGSGGEERAAAGRGVNAHQREAVQRADLAIHVGHAQNGEVVGRAHVAQGAGQGVAVDAAVERHAVRFLVLHRGFQRQPLADELVFSHARALENPVAGVQGVVAVALRARVAALWPVHAGDAERRVEDGVVPGVVGAELGRLFGVVLPTLVADHRPAVVAVTHLPPHDVAAQAGEAAAPGHELLHPLAHVPRPVFAVAGNDRHVVVGQQVGVEMQIIRGGVFDRVAVALQPRDHLGFPILVFADAVAVGPVEADLRRLDRGAEAVEGAAAEVVVSLVGIDRRQEQQARTGAGVFLAHPEDHRPDAARLGNEVGDVGPRRPVVRNGEAGRRRPAAAGGIAVVAIVGGGGDVVQRGHQLARRTLAVDGNRGDRAGIDGNVEVERLTLGNRHLRGVAAEVVNRIIGRHRPGVAALQGAARPQSGATG